MIRKLLKNMLGDGLTQENDKYQKINYFIIVISFVAFGCLYFFLPEQIPVLHQGDKLIYIPSLLGVFLAPALLAVINFTLVIQKRVNKFNTILLGVVSAAVFVYYLTMLGN